MNKRLIAVFFLVMGAAVFGNAQEQAKPPVKPVDVAGAWELTMTGPQGEFIQTTTFVQDKNIVKVTMVSQMGEATGEGTVEGNEVKWAFTISTPNGDFTIGFKAKVDGEKMTGEVEMGDMGTASFWGQKKKLP